MKIKIIEHIQSRKGDRLLIEIPKELSYILVNTPDEQEVELSIVVNQPSNPPKNEN